MGYFLTVLTIFFGNLISGVSVHMVLSLSGIIFLGMPTVAKLSNYAIAISEKAGVSPGASFLVGLAVTLISSVLFARLFIRVSLESFVVLGLSSILALEALAKSWESLTNGTLGISGIERPDFLPGLKEIAIISGVFAIIFLVAEFILLKTWVGRAVRAYKEDAIVLESMGVSSNRLVQSMIIISGVLLTFVSASFIWRVQFLDPYGMIPYLVELLTLGILALQPKLRYVMLGAIFITAIPEVLRLFNFPATYLGYIRLLVYSLLLIILIRKLSNTHLISRRSI